MNERTMETRRLDQVERENRRLKRLGVVAVAVIGGESARVEGVRVSGKPYSIDRAPRCNPHALHSYTWGT